MEITDQNFEENVREGVTLVDFWAPWCGPCQMLGPIIEEIAEEFEGKAIVGKLNVDDNPQVAQKHQVRSIPMIGVFVDGELKETVVGVNPKETYVALLNKYLQEESK